MLVLVELQELIRFGMKYNNTFPRIYNEYDSLLDAKRDLDLLNRDEKKFILTDTIDWAC
jgi:hypothetical protein